MEKQSSIFFGSNEESFNLKEFLYKYIQYWYWYVLVVLLAVLSAFLYLRYTVPQYSMKATLLLKIDEKGGSGGGISEEDVLGELSVFKNKKNVDNEILILKSQSTMEQVVRQLGIDVNYIRKGRIRDEEQYNNSPVKAIPVVFQEKMYGKQWAVSYISPTHFSLRELHEPINEVAQEFMFGQVIGLPQGKFILNLTSPIGWEDEIIVSFHKVEDVAKQYSEALVVKPPRTSTVLELSIIDAVPEKGKDVLNSLIKEYQETGIEDKNRVASNTIKFIEERLRFLTQDLSEVERNIEHFKKDNEIIDVAGQATQTLNSQSSYAHELYEKETQIELLKITEGYLRNKANEYTLLPNSLGFSDLPLSNLIVEYNKLLLDREKMLKTTQENNPIVQVVNGQLNSLRSNILENSQNLKNNLTSIRNGLLLKNGSIISKIRAIPTQERQFQEIQRQQNIKQNLYLYLLQKREETELSRAVTAANSRILDAASTPLSPIKPNRNLAYLIALLIGLLLPTIVITVQQILDDAIKTRADIEENTQVPILGGIGVSKTIDKVAVRKGSRTGVAESFRMLRTNLEFLAVSNKKNKTILVTSSMGGEGKSFITLNLAASLALSGKKTIMLELDLRKPKLIRYLSNQKISDVGVTNYLVSDIDVKSIIQRSEIDTNLSFIGSGPIPPNPVELLMNDKIDSLFEYLKSEYDYIVLDTPPVGLVTDAIVLNRVVDVGLYVARYGITRKPQLHILQDIYVQKKFNNTAIVFNAVKTGGGYGYGYGYGYGAGYYEEERSGKGIWNKIKTIIA